MMIHNPILRGFHPDPSIVRVGEDYYIATSTFEWWPAVRLHHSRNLVNWEPIGYALTDASRLDLRGVGPSQGIWAPDLSYDQGCFYLIYTVVKAFYCNMYDTHNYLVTAADIHGPWSEPVPLNNFGFDPSLLHDTDGRKYIVSMATDHRVPKKYAGRLVLQEYDPARKQMTGPVRDIYQAKDIFLEGPHLFRRKDWYYLFCADTGTGELHGQTILRAKNVWGPYEMFRPEDPYRKDGEAYSILTARNHPDVLLQKAGHCDLVETTEGEWYAVHLCGRKISEKVSADAAVSEKPRRYMLGRETAIQKMRWRDDDWLVMADGGNTPREFVDAPKSGADWENQTNAADFEWDDFDVNVLHADYQSLRIPMDEHYVSLQARPGWLRMYGRSGLASRFTQTLIARRMTEYHMEAYTCVDFEPENFKEMAGLILMYDTDNYLYLHISWDEDCGKCISLLKAENRNYQYLTEFLPLKEEKDVVLGLHIDGPYVQFSYGYRREGDKNRFSSACKGECIPIGPKIDASFLSDEACREGWFTGTMIGICCQDLTGFGKYADFDWFCVKNL
ncbi:MAG: family 43 glycosylhydrolase [Clostridiales bacterium]|nr:family 43 glycosylhydrolase [Clostridiales bacterium]